MIVGIVEDIASIREGYTTYLESLKEVQLVIAASSGESFLKQIESFPPDIVLMDIGLPKMSGIECMQQLKKIHPEVQIVMLTVYDDSDRIFSSLMAGAEGYLLKNTPLSELKEALLTIRGGNSSMSPSIARKVIEFFRPEKKPENGLTSKESEVVQGLVDGLSYKLIADRMDVSINTVRQHIRNIYKKLHVNSKAEVIAMMLKQH